jgi:YggT family protein
MNTNPTMLMKIAGIGSTMIGLYTFLIWIRVIITWIRIPGTQMGNNGLTKFLIKVVDPFLYLFSGVKWLRRGAIDFTPILGFILLSIVQSILSIYSIYGTITLGIILALSLQTLWASIISFIFWIFMIALALRLFFFYKSGPAPISINRIISNLTESMINWTQRVFFQSNIANDGHLILVSLILVVTAYILIRMGLGKIIPYLYSL